MPHLVAAAPGRDDIVSILTAAVLHARGTIMAKASE
jgi:hypothetical protein